MSSQTAVFLPIISALVASEKILGPNRIWTPTNPEQEAFLENYFSQRESLSKLSPEELRNWVSRVASELNQVLKKEGFDIQLPEFEPNEFGVASILDVSVSWLLEGERSKVFNEPKQKPYDAVKIKQWEEGENDDPVRMFNAVLSSNHPHPIAQLNTTSGDLVYMTIADQSRSGFDLLNTVEKIRSGIAQAGASKSFEHLVFPMVDLNQEVGIEWIANLQTIDQDGYEAKVKKALQQTKFKMNEKGAHVKSAVGMVMISLGFSMEDNLVINEPFFLWIERPGLSVPILAAYLDIENWKDPGGLEM